MRTLHVISPLFTPSRSRFVNCIARPQQAKPAAR
jgi:hypothetical protein